MIQKITIILSFLVTSIAFGQHYVDMEKELSNVNGHLTIDGNMLQHKHNTKEQIIITGKDLVLNDRTSFSFNNILLQLTGKIIIKGSVKPRLIDSFIFCRDSGALTSSRVIETDNFEDVAIGNVSYIKELKGNPELWVYSPSGKRIFKGTKKEALSFSVPISRYDVKIVGVGFKDNVLFAY